MDRIDAIRTRLNKQLQPRQLDIIDQSALHVGHSGHGGAGHFEVHIAADQFQGQSLLACHRMVYAALHDLMNTEIHALSIQKID